MINLFVFAKKKAINHQIKERLPSQEMVIGNESETDQSDKGKDIFLSRVTGNKFETEHKDKDKDKDKDEIMIAQNQTPSKRKIELKKNPIFQPNSLTKNMPSKDISDRK